MPTGIALIAVGLFLICPELAAQGPDGAGGDIGNLDWIEQLQKGGIIIVFLGALSVLGLAFTLERIFNLRKGSFAPDDLIKRATELWFEDDMHGLQNICQQRKSTISRAIIFITKHTGEDFNFISEGAADICARDIKMHQQRAYMLSIVATLAPLLGLLGTVIGMIEAFAMVASVGSMGDASILADSISKALVTTAVGLVVAIPTLGLYHMFRQRTAKLALVLEEALNDLLIDWFKRDYEEE